MGSEACDAVSWIGSPTPLPDFTILDNASTRIVSKKDSNKARYNMDSVADFGIYRGAATSREESVGVNSSQPYHILSVRGTFIPNCQPAYTAQPLNR